MGDLYELATLAAPLLALGRLAEAARSWVTAPEAGGQVLGLWRTEIGPLGRIMVLRGFDDAAALAQERQRALLSANPFHGAGILTGLEMDSYRRFPFLPPVPADHHHAVYEFRHYRLKPGGLPQTLAGWEAALGLARDYAAHLLVNMYALDGPPRITHLWGFSSLEQRMALRSAAYAAGTWPPKGGPENIAEAMSVIALPER